MNNKGLLRCPFCGGEAKYDNSDGYDYIFCHECGARTFGFNKEHAFNEWNKRAKYVNNVNNKGNSSEFPNSSKEMPLVPKWVSHYSGGESLDVSISQYKKLRFRIYDTDGSSNFKYHCDCTVINFIADKDSCIFEEVGEFNTIEEAKAKANECIRKLGERLVYFANNIKTEE